MESQPLVVYCSCPDLTVAERIAETVVAEHLAACVNIVPGLISIYRWQGQMQRESEVLLMLKTREAVYPLLETRIFELHPYEVPEVIAIPITLGATSYLNWLDDNTGAPV